MVHDDKASCSNRQQIDVDQLLAKKKADAFIWHDDHFAYVVTFTEDVCIKIHRTAQARLGICGERPILTESVYQGMRNIGNNEASQRREHAVYTANFGLTERAQKSTRFCIGRRSKLIDALLGCHCWGKVRTNAVRNTHSCSSVVKPLYTTKFRPIFDDPNLQQFDRWYGERDNGLGPGCPRFTPGNKYENRETVQVPCPLVSSIMRPLDTEETQAVLFEEQLRTISEWKLLNALHSIPYGTTASIVASNLTDACKYGESVGKKLPCWSLCCPFPKGACGIQKTKGLHDDGNAGIIPGIWSSILGDPDVVLRSISPNTEIFFRASTD
jgi:hypothetical protein